MDKQIYLFSFQNSFDVTDILLEPSLSTTLFAPYILPKPRNTEMTWCIANETPLQQTFFTNRCSRQLLIFCYIAESNSIDKVSTRDNRWYESYCCWWKKL